MQGGYIQLSFIFIVKKKLINFNDNDGKLL